MDNYRRKQTITDEQINQFIEVEVAKIVEYPDILTQKLKFYKKPLAIVLGIVATMILVISLGLFIRPETPNFDVTELSNHRYLMSSIEADISLELYYGSMVVMEASRISLNDLFDYKSLYMYAPEELMDDYPVEFSAYKIGYRYFLMAEVNGEVSVAEVDYFVTSQIVLSLDLLEIDDLNRDIRSLFDWIVMYPPVLSTTSAYPTPFDVNPEVNSLPDSIEKRNYVNYVENYYKDDSSYSPEDNQDRSETISVFLQHAIVVNSEGKFASASFAGWSVTFNVPISIDGQFAPMTDLNQFFAFYPKNQSSPLFGMSYNVADEEENISFSLFQTEYLDNVYLYGLFDFNSTSIDLSQVARVDFEYTLIEQFGSQTEVLTLTPFIYNRALVIPITQILTDSNPIPYPLFTTFTLKFYDESNNIITQFHGLLLE